ncbi:MAG: GxxExxY protein [Gammaproteobacteria bacterium]|nr:GxxExxY protein [Gammaproteobacteria bacterium]
MNKDQLNALSNRVIGAALTVHRELGPGLLESTYEACLWHELNAQGISAIRQVALPVVYKGMEIDCGYRVDLFIEDELIMELKSVETLQLIHEAQLVTYLKLSGSRLGLLINFNAKALKHGIRRLVNGIDQKNPLRSSRPSV